MTNARRALDREVVIRGVRCRAYIAIRFVARWSGHLSALELSSKTVPHAEALDAAAELARRAGNLAIIDERKRS